jgi:hypothetical protein
MIVTKDANGRFVSKRLFMDSKEMAKLEKRKGVLNATKPTGGGTLRSALR